MSGGKLRVLQVAHGFPPYQSAGAEIVAHGLARALSGLGHPVEVFHRYADPSVPEYSWERDEVDSLPVVRVNNTFRDCGSFEETYRNGAIDRIFDEHLETFRPDVVHFHHVTCLSTNLIAVASRRGIPVAYTLHDYWLICQRGQFLKRDLSVCPGQDDGECVKCLAWQLDLDGGPARVRRALRGSFPALGRPGAAGLKRLVRRAHGLYARAFFASQGQARRKMAQRMDHVREMCGLVDRFLAPSRFLRERYVEFGVPEDRILHSTYGFDRSFYGAPRPARGDKVRFGFLGTWIPPKGLHVLVEAFNGIEDPRASLHLYGHALPYEGWEDYLESLKGMIRSPRIHLEGSYDNRQVGEILAGLDVLVVPSIWYENSPLTIQEALLAGVPVITSDFGGMSELIRDGVNGLTFRPRDSRDLGDKIRSLLGTDGRLERLRPRDAPIKSVEESARECEALYRSLLEERSAAGRVPA